MLKNTGASLSCVPTKEAFDRWNETPSFVCRTDETPAHRAGPVSCPAPLFHHMYTRFSLPLPLPPLPQFSICTFTYSYESRIRWRLSSFHRTTSSHRGNRCKTTCVDEQRTEDRRMRMVEVARIIRSILLLTRRYIHAQGGRIRTAGSTRDGVSLKGCIVLRARGISLA